MNPFRPSTLLVAIASCTLPSAALAQYSSDPATPLAIVANKGDDVQPKIAANPFGGQYISYFAGPGYDVYLDRRDASGNSVWGSAVLVENRDLSSTTDYGLTVDPNGNAYLVYNMSNPKSSSQGLLKMTSVAPDGTIRWSTTLHNTAAGATNIGNGRATVGTDGFVWGAASIGFDSSISRVNPSTGAIANAVFLSESSTVKQICSGLQPSTDGAVIFSTIRYTTFTSPKVLRLRRINSDGTYGWGGQNGTAAFTVGSVQTGNFPDFIPDGTGGAYVPWYSTSPLNCRLQRFDASGTVMFGSDGVAVSTATSGTVGGVTTTLNRTNPATIVGGDGRVYVFYRAYTGSIAGAVWYGIGAQCFDSTGNRMWGDGGVMIEDYTASTAGVYDRNMGAASLFQGSPGCSYADSSTASQATAKACRMNSDGTVAWTAPFASNAGSKYRFVASSGDASAIFAWQNAVSSGAGDIFAARVNADGTVGDASVPGDLNDDGLVDGADLTIMLASWGPCPGCVADLNGDGVVAGADLALLLADWTG